MVTLMRGSNGEWSTAPRGRDYCCCLIRFSNLWLDFVNFCIYTTIDFVFQLRTYCLLLTALLFLHKGGGAGSRAHQVRTN